MTSWRRRLAPAILVATVLGTGCTSGQRFVENEPPAETSASTVAPTSTIAETPSDSVPLPTIAAPRLRAPRIITARTVPDAPDGPLAQRLPDLTGEVITMLGPETGEAAESLVEAFGPFEELTGARIDYTGTVDDVTILDGALDGEGEIPDIVVVAQPGRLSHLADLPNGARPVPPLVESVVRKNFDPFWSELVRIDGAVHGVPSKASVKSLVWYSPQRFEDLEYEIPTTWAGLEELAARMRFEGRTPWCIGIGSGDSTGWVVTDWIEELLLRRLGPEVYDQWVAHQIPANDPAVIEVVEEVGGIFHRPGNVLVDNGVQDIATIGFAEAGLPVLNGSCMMHRQASFYGSNYAEADAAFGTEIDVFYLPTVDDDEFGRVVLGAGDFFVPMRSTAATAALLAYAADPAYADARAAASAGGFLSANRFQDTSVYRNPIDRRMADVLVQADPFRFDGSDLMPAIVGSGELWTAGTTFAAGAITAAEYLDRVEAAWSLVE